MDQVRNNMELTNIDGATDDLRPIIRESWERSKQYGVSPEHLVVHELSPKELSYRLEKNRTLLQLAGPMIRVLFKMTENTQHIIALFDEDGYILDCITSTPEQDFDKYRFKVGVKWSEEVVGTTANTLAFLQDKPTVVSGREHYNQKLKGITEYSDTIHDVHGRQIACLGMGVEAEENSVHTLVLVALGTYIIESQMALVKSYELMDDMLDTISEGLIILDEDLNIQSVSYRLCQMFRMDRSSLYQHNISEFFAPENFRKKVFEIKKPFSYVEYDFTINGTVQSYNVSVTPMNLAGRITGVILLLRESKAVNKVANIITGNRARYSFDDIITEDPKMRNIVTTMKQVADSMCTVLIEGESGTGKELFAHSIHNYSSREKGPFVAVNCASLPQSLIESELFGYEKGAFTGALHEGNPGKFELADGGTIFLDEIGELPLDMQAKLLRVLDTHRTIRIGGKTEKVLNIRVIAATNRDLGQEVASNNFREDLYYRINVLKFNIPPLRNRQGDIARLANYFIKRIADQEGTPPKKFSQDFLEALEGYSWPGNVRELQNAISRAHYICNDYLITRDHLPENIQNAVGRGIHAPQPQLSELVQEKEPAFEAGGLSTVDELERQCIIRALKQYNGHVINAGKSLGISKSSMYRKLKKYGIDVK